ncbi:HAD hydrolase-like protein, partial [Patescibacteria group bacterium]|nr:HAD hydrolase-like protein [Patescibacteria group bacterium]
KKEEKMIKLIVSGFDGTLVDAVPFYHGMVVSIYERFNENPPSLEEFKKSIAGDMDGIYHDRKLILKEKEVKSAIKSYLKEHWNEYRLQSYAREFIQICRAIHKPVIALSSNKKGLIKKSVKKFQLKGIIDEVISTKDKGKTLKYLMEEFSVKDGEIIYIDDKYGSLVSAKSAGATTIGFLGGFHTKNLINSAKPDYTVSSLQEATKLILQLRI